MSDRDSSHASVEVSAARYATRLVVWTRAWRAGCLSFDEVAPAVMGGVEHLVNGVIADLRAVALTQALTAFSGLSSEEICLVLPAPGDPRGLPGPGAFTNAALASSAAVYVGKTGLVPTVRSHISGSGDVWHTVTWQAYDVPGDAGEFIDLGEAEADLSQELLNATEAFIKLDIARWQPEVAKALAALHRPHPTDGDLPVGYSPRARRVYARAMLIDQLLVLVDQSAPGGAVTSAEALQRVEALRPLRTASRRALVAVCSSKLS